MIRDQSSLLQELWKPNVLKHYSNITMSAIASQITGASAVYSIFCPSADQRKHQNSASLSFVSGIHPWPVSSPRNGPVTRKPSKLAFTQSLCVLFVLEILGSSTKLTFVLTLCAWYLFHVSGCVLSVYHLSSHWTRAFTYSLRCYWAHGELKMVEISTSWTKKSWTYASTNFLGNVSIW